MKKMVRKKYSLIAFAVFSLIFSALLNFNFAFAGPEIGAQGSFAGSYVSINETSYLNPTEISGTYLNRNYIWINVTSNISDFHNVTIYLFNDSSVLNLSNYTLNPTYWINFSSLTEGLWFFNATIFNTTGAGNFTATRNITVDTVGPFLGNISSYDVNNTIIARNNLFLNFSIFDLNFKNISIRLYNSSFNLINSSTNATTGIRTWLNHSMNFTELSDADGLYYYDAIVYDLAGNSNYTGLRQIILNVSFPILNSTTPATSSSDATIRFTSNKIVNVSLSYGTTTALGTNKSISSFNYGGTFTLTGLTHSTTYYYNLTLCDRAGNCVTNGTQTLTTTSTNTTTTTGDTGSTTVLNSLPWLTSYYPSEAELISLTGYRVQLSSRGRAIFKIGTENHQVGVIYVDKVLKQATINVSSTPQQAVFNIGDEKKFDVNADDSYDVSITLVNITSLGKAEVVIKKISEKISVTSDTPSPEAQIPEEATPKTNQKTLALVIIIVLVVLIIVLSFLRYRKKRRYYMFGF